MRQFSDKAVGKIQVSITEKDIANIIIGSFEGGSDYWMGLDNTTTEWNDKPKDEPVSTWASKLILEGKAVSVYDIEEDTTTDDDGNPLTIDLKKLIKGIQMNHIERTHDNDLENADAITYDCIVQYAIFGEVVYG
jgi:hypothetical protein